MELKEMAYAEGFADAAIIPTEQIPFNEVFREFCAENLCGQYGVNYACPPDSGTFSEMRDRVLARKQALVLQTLWDISDYSDKEAIRQAKAAHNAAMLRLKKQMAAGGMPSLMAGASGCALCSPCQKQEGKPCRFPEDRYSCMSAYCVFVKELADRCGMEYSSDPGEVAFFGMLLYD